MSFSLFSSRTNKLEVQDREQLLQTTRRLISEVQALSSRIAAVNEIANAINHSLNIDEILQVVGRQAKWLLDFQHCSVCLRNDDSSYRLVTLFGSSISCSSCPIGGDNPIGRTLGTGQSQLNPKDYISTFLSAYPSQIIIPLQRENHIIGSINFATCKTAYSQEDLRIGGLLAMQLSSAVGNAKCFEEMNKLLEEMNQLYSQLEGERRKSDELLLNTLPKEIANELKETGKVKPVYHEAASVLFTDFTGFTQLTEQLTPEALVDELDFCFSYFDTVSEAYNLEKLKTIGDSYMGVAGIPVPRATHAIDAVLAALQIQSFMYWRRIEKARNNKPYWDIRIGIHSGSLLAGVIGRKKFTYDVWGDTVNTASRMESSAIPGTINISQATFELVKNFFDCEYRGKIGAKNKGSIDMYLVSRIKKYLATDSLGLIPNDKFYRIYSALKNQPQYCSE
ncbi:GAF domain-containing protein [Coleofasciculus sp. LEGE 07092]|nr:adenylate/guanylate cyclase domain-containing protein [Coleofasciculus sp. LEGE 07081]MBE9127942.1 GAF domain-containing protein [Coleofasciculus sp. LEGE 07081]MBE9151102.1 GAF domain-containing protein [Coleofasciculus sp. LEGE 07092]